MASAPTSSAVKLEPYGDLIDLYAARTVRARIITLSEPAPPSVRLIGRRATTSRAAMVAAKLDTAHIALACIVLLLLSATTWAAFLLA